MITKIRHSGIVVSDLEAALRFYRDLLGFKVTKQMEEGGEYIDRVLGLKKTKVTTVKLSSPDGQMIELLKYHSHPKVKEARAINSIGLTHLAFEVDKLDQEYARLKSAGIVFTSPPETSPDGYAKVAFCEAPEGIFIELVEVLKK